MADKKVFRKLQVFTITTDFKAATKIATAELVPPQADQIRVKNIFAGVNATDINTSAARYFTDGKVPFDIGLEGVGLVDAIGSSVPAGKFQVGQPVLSFFGEVTGAFSEYFYQPYSNLISLPELKPEYLVAAVNGLTASIALDRAGHVKKGDKVLITAAAGGTGQIAVQWAKHRGAYVIALTSSEAKAEYLKQIGADFVINYNKDDLEQVLQKEFPDGVDVVWETIGGKTFETLFNALADKGRLIIIGIIESYKKDGLFSPAIDNINTKLLMGSKSLTGFILPHYANDYAEYLDKLIKLISDGSFKIKVDLGLDGAEGGPFVGLESVHRAEEHLHARKNIGKVVVKIQDP